MNKISFKITDIRGNATVACPRCGHEFKQSAESIRKYGVICPMHKASFEFSEKCLSRQDKTRIEKMQHDWIVENLPSIKIEL